ncbi:MAG: hypothetical protein R3C11_18565 [Planctomycetaceae bacterium]
MFQHPNTIDSPISRPEFGLEDDVHLTPLDEDHPLHLVSDFKACLIGDMLVYKLGAFITDLNASLTHIDENKVFMKVGKRRFLPSLSGCT